MKKTSKKEMLMILKNIKDYSSDTISVYPGIKEMCIGKLNDKIEKKFEEYKRDNLILLRISKIIEKKIKNNSKKTENLHQFVDLMILWNKYQKKFSFIEKQIHNILKNGQK